MSLSNDSNFSNLRADDSDSEGEHVARSADRSVKPSHKQVHKDGLAAMVVWPMARILVTGFKPSRASAEAKIGPSGRSCSDILAVSTSGEQQHYNSSAAMADESKHKTCVSASAAHEDGRSSSAPRSSSVHSALTAALRNEPVVEALMTSSAASQKTLTSKTSGDSACATSAQRLQRARSAAMTLEAVDVACSTTQAEPKVGQAGSSSSNSSAATSVQRLQRAASAAVIDGPKNTAHVITAAKPADDLLVLFDGWHYRYPFLFSLLVV